MSVVPTEWREPDSRPGFYYDLLWTTLAVVAIGAVAYWEPFSIAVSVTPTRLLGSLAAGGAFALTIAYGAFASERLGRLWADARVRFGGLFALIMAGQLGLAVAPTWTLLTLLATFLAFVPLRTYVYLRTR